MSSPEASPEYSRAERKQLLAMALGSIESALGHPRAASPGSPVTGKLAMHRACFVTLTCDSVLRGCIGSLEAFRPLAEDVIRNAHAAAFRDPRFSPLSSGELDSLTIEISILGKPERLEFDSEPALIGMIRPGTDGLILQEHTARGTFLPSVWDSLPEPARFLAHLKLKAGLPADYWSDAIEVWRYTTEAFSAPVAAISASEETPI